MRLGAYVLGLAAIATGFIDIVWGGFESAHQPIQAFGDNVPGRQIFAYVIAALLIAGGAALLRKTTARFGAAALGLAYAVFAVFWAPRFYTAPLVLGHHASVYIGVLGGFCCQVIVIAAALLIYGWASADASLWPQRVTAAARWLTGLSCVDFGLAHLTGIASNAPMVPKWLPPDQSFWVILTGTAFVLAGIAILIKVSDLLAVRLLALMLLVFSAVSLVPQIAAYPHNQIVWGSNAYNLVAAASVWILACSIAASRRSIAAPQRTPSFA